MYHTCDRKKEPELTYLEPFSIHPHISGIDVAFENKEKKFRASFLIRGFQCEKDIKPEKRSTYIYEELLMNFSLEEGVSIKWHDKMCNEGEVSTNEVRKNISAYLKTTDGSEAGAYKKDEKGNYIKQYIDQANRKGFVQCERKWRYTKQL